MAHPFASQAKSSQRARLRRLGATAGKPHGASNMYKKKTLPSKNAGRDVGFTIPGGKAASRADRMANGGVAGKRKPHHTTNIVISAPGGRAMGAPGPIGARQAGPQFVHHIHRHVAAGPPVAAPLGGAPLGAGLPLRPPIGAAPPVGGPPVGGAPPILPRPPMGAPAVGAPGMKAGGSVRKAKIGGDTSPGRGYRGFPHSPTTEVDSAVSARKRGGKFADGGAADGDTDEDQTKPPTMRGGGKVKSKSVKKRQMGGMGGAQQQPPGLLGMPMPGRAPLPPQQGAPNISGTPARPAQPLTVPMPPTLASMRARPAPGTTTAFKQGGHADEAEDKKLIKSMLAKEEKKENKAEKRKRGGIAPSIEGGKSVLGAIHADQNIASVPKKSVPKGHATVLHGDKYKDWGKGKRKRGGTTGETTAPHGGMAAPIYRSLGTGYRAQGGSVQAPYGSGSGLGRLRKEKSAAKVPDKTEL